jgi:hypothetical protein
VDSKLYSDLCIAHDCFMLSMVRSFQFNALSRENQRPNLSYKRAGQDTFRGIQSISVATRNCATLLLESSLLKIDISLVTVYMTSTHIEPAVTSHLQPINQADIYTSS